jgi:hypothetical protein
MWRRSCLGDKLLSRTRGRWEDVVKVDSKEMGWEGIDSAGSR